MGEEYILGNMKEEESARFIAKKAYEVGYALCRVAARTRPPLAPRLEDCAFRILESSTALNVVGVRNSLELAKNYVRMASDSNILHKPNAELLLSELMKFDSFLTEVEEINFSAKANLAGVFSSTPLSEKKRIEGERDIVAVPGEVERQSAKDRQSAILAFINKFGNCRMKDFLESFSGTSERTLRYDLQGLAEQGAIERVGEGGPGTYYRAKLPQPPSPQGFPSIPLPGGSNL